MPSIKPWERQKGESGQAYEAFSLYRDKGLQRTVTAVVNELGKSRSLIDRWKVKWDWENRVRAYDNDVEKKAKAEAEKGLRDMYARQTKISMQLQSKALEALNNLDIEAMTPRDIKEYIKMATDLERLNRTSSAGVGADGSTKQAESLANTIIAAYERRKESGQ